MSKVKANVIKVRVKATQNRQDSIINSENTQTNQPEKHTPWEIVKGIFRGIGMLGMCFLSYNAALALVAIIGCGMAILMDELFVTLVNSTAFMDVFRNVFNWACAHLTLSVTVLAILYIIGFLWFIYDFVNRLAGDLYKQE